ncbi:MAG: hypothetical protein QW212_00745 [Nitrososphaerales archaeon]
MSNLLVFFVVTFNFLSILCGLAQGYGTPYVTTLTADISSTATTIPVASTTGFASSDFIWIDDERIAYTGTTATAFNNCIRGVGDQNNRGGTPTEHKAGAAVYTEGMNALNALLGFNYASLRLSYGTPIAIILSTFAYIGSIPRFIFWNVGFMEGSGWSLVKIIILYPLSAGFVLAFMFFLIQIIWMLKPNVL